MILPKTRKEAKILGSSYYYTGKLCLNKHDSKRKTVNGVCYVCSLENTNKWLRARPEYNRDRAKKWKNNNPDKHNDQHLKRCEKYRKTQKLSVAKSQKKYRLSNKSKVLSLVRKRQANKLNATPPWLSNEHLIQIECKYSVSQMLSKYGVEKFQVDHIIPLQSKIVCGLHVPWNLQVITSLENRKKSNKLD